MKKTFLRSLMAPMAVIILGSLGAFGTMSMGSNPNAPGDQRGYRYVSPLEPCVQDIMCSTIVFDVCKTPTLQTLWGKNAEPDNHCPKTLYKKQ